MHGIRSGSVLKTRTHPPPAHTQATFEGTVLTKGKHAAAFLPGYLVLLTQTLKIFDSADSFADGEHCINRLSLLDLELNDDLGITRRGHFRFEVHDASGDAP